MKKRYFILLSTFFSLFHLNAQDLSDFIGQWNYDYSEVQIGEEWKTKTEVYDFEQEEDATEKVDLEIENSDKEITPEDFFKNKNQEEVQNLLLLDKSFTYRFSPKESDFGKVNLFIKSFQNSITDYSAGYLRYSILEDKVFKLYNDHTEEIYTITFYDKEEFILQNNTSNTKIHFKRI